MKLQSIQQETHWLVQTIEFDHDVLIQIQSRVIYPVDKDIVKKSEQQRQCWTKFIKPKTL